MSRTRRQLSLFCADSFGVAHDYVLSLSLGDFTVINATNDFNQNKWLGIEIGNTLIYFDESTPINNLLSVLGCIRGGSTVILSYPSSLQNSYFKSSIFLPALKKVAQPVQLHLKQSHQQSNPLKLSTGDKNILQQLTNNIAVLHLIGMRGTGKSTLLGCFIHQQLQKQNRVLYCAPSKKSATNALLRLDDVSRETFAFVTPKQLLSVSDHYDILVIDEAASLPNNLIDTIIQNIKHPHQRLILSTTIEGYEGTGQSYRLKYLNESSNHIIELKETKRFASDDYLHRFSQWLCKPKQTTTTLADGNYLFNTEQLREHHLVENCYALLRQAHYKTTPNDLARFYDDDAQYAIAVRSGHVIAALRSQHEAIPKDLPTESIYHGKRRCKNALTQQAIIQSYGNINHIKDRRLLRIERIATKASYRRQHIATQLIDLLHAYAITAGYDFLSTSFSASENNELFWQAQSFCPVRIGLHKNKWLNQYALLMLKPLTPQAEITVSELYERYTNHLQYYLQYYRKAYPKWLFTTSHSNDREGQGGQQVTITTEDIKASLISVTEYHRDIHWLLPELVSYQQQNKQIYPPAIVTLLNGQLIKKSALAEAKADLSALYSEIV